MNTDIYFLLRCLQHTIGAFLSEPLKTPCRRVIGNGESFLFTLADGKKSGNFAPARKYPWAKKSKEKSPAGNLFIVEPPSPGAASMRCEGTMMQFAVFSATSMTFGASEAFGTNAVRIDAELSVCQCGPSDTYGNSTYSILTGNHNTVNTKSGTGQEANGTAAGGAGNGTTTGGAVGGGGSFRIESMEVYGDRHSSVAP